MTLVRKFKVLKEFEGSGAVGTVHEVNTTDIDADIEKRVQENIAAGEIEEVTEQADNLDDSPTVTEEDAEAAAEASLHPVEPVEVPAKFLMYNGKEVVSNSVRTVNGKDYHHVQLISGESLDISDLEYETMVAVSNKI